MRKLLIFITVFIPLVAFGFYFFKLSEVEVPTLKDLSDYIEATSTQKIIKKVEEKIAELPPVLSKKTTRNQFFQSMEYLTPQIGKEKQTGPCYDYPKIRSSIRLRTLGLRICLLRVILSTYLRPA